MRSVIVLGLLTVLLGGAAVLAPVVADDPVVTWPRAGEAPTSTVLPLSPYRPLGLRAEIPCATLAAVDRRGGGEVLRTLPADVDATLGTGLVVAVSGGIVRFSTGPELLVESLPRACSLSRCPRSRCPSGRSLPSRCLPAAAATS